MSDYWDNPRGKAAYEAIQTRGDEIHAVQHADGHRTLGVWFNDNWQRGCMTPDIWLPDVESLELFANLGRQGYADLERRKNAYEVQVEYDDGTTVRYHDNHEARQDMVYRYQRQNQWPSTIQGINPFSRKTVSELEAHKHGRYVIVLRPKGENPQFPMNDPAN